MTENLQTLYQRPAELLQRLIRFDTTNPPGNEGELITFVNQLLTDAGIPTQILAKTPTRPNLIARLPGRGDAPPLLLQGHVDVVTTEGQKWRYPPFEARIADGYIWGRGALDMKGGVAMMLAAFLRAKAENADLPGDVILLLLSDEEAGSDMGARFLVEEHPELFAGVRYAIGEFGGFPMAIGGKRFYPIQVAEKHLCWMKATVHGPAGHASMPVRGGAMAKLADLLQKLDQNRLPVHITPVVKQMIETIADALDGPMTQVMRQLLNPAATDQVLDRMGPDGRLFDAMLHNTVSPTILHGSSKINVIPGEASVEIDGRILPGMSSDDLIRELRDLVGEEVEFQVMRADPGPAEPDLSWFDTLGDILRESDPEGIPVPLLISGVTDARYFSQLGIQTYGYLPMNLPPDFNFQSTIHAADERIPVEAVAFGANAIYKALQRTG